MLSDAGKVKGILSIGTGEKEPSPLVAEICCLLVHSRLVSGGLHCNSPFGGGCVGLMESIPALSSTRMLIATRDINTQQGELYPPCDNPLIVRRRAIPTLRIAQ